jgi:hypothetical protein
MQAEKACDDSTGGTTSEELTVLPWIGPTTEDHRMC